MENLGDWVSILIILIPVMTALLKKIKPAQTPTTASPLPGSAPKEADSEKPMLTDVQPNPFPEKNLWEERSTPQSKNNYNNKAAKRKASKRKENTSMPAISSVEADSILTPLESIESLSIHPHSTSSNEALVNLFQGKDDLKRAIVLSEILNRKYE